MKFVIKKPVAAPAKPALKPAPAPVAKAAPVAKPVKKAKPAAEAAQEYRHLRKYTKLKLSELVQDVTTIRHAIGTPKATGDLKVSELLAYLDKIESDTPEWRKKSNPAPDGQPRKRGRPSKADIAAREAAVKTLGSPGQEAAAISKVKSFAKKAAPAPAAPVAKPAPVAAKKILIKRPAA